MTKRLPTLPPRLARPRLPGEDAHPFVFGCFAYYLMSLAFEGPLRHLLTILHLQTFIYARDLIAVLTVLYYIATPAVRNNDLLKPVVVCFYALLTHAVLSLWLSVPLGSVLFSIKVFMSVLYGMAVADMLGSHRNQLLKLFWIIFSISTLGVMVNEFVGTFPWEGDAFESAFGTNLTTKVWWAGGERRLPGFSRASYSAAMAIGLSGAFCIAQARSLLVKLMALGAGMATIYLTTSKGMVAAFALCGLWLTFSQDTPESRKAGLKIIFVLALVCVAVPVISDLYDGNPTEIKKVPRLLASFWDRISESWPQTFVQLEKNYGFVLGKGLGGVGIAIKMGANNTNVFVPIDNIFWYFYSVFGLIGVYYTFYAAKRVAHFPDNEPAQARSLIAVAMVMIGYGITSVMFEDAFFSILFGLLIGWPNIITKNHKNNQKRHASIN